MYGSHRLLPMVQVKYIKSNIMSIHKCDRCNGRAIFIGADGSWRCVICTPKEFIWNKETLKYE